MKALLLGSVGVLAETSDMQREAFNSAFAEAGLDWNWGFDAYRNLLDRPGGAGRIADYAERRGQSVDADALHARKSALFRDRLAAGVPLRPGVAETIAAAKDAGLKLALVSTTAPDIVAAVIAATGLDRETFDLVITAADVTRVKPHYEAFTLALLRLDLMPPDAIAVEDNPAGFKSAVSAGLRTYAFPGALHSSAMFDGAEDILDRLELPLQKGPVAR